MATAAKVTHPHIVKRPDYCSGKAAIDNTRVRVMNVVGLHKEGKTAAEIQEAYPDLSLAQVYAALTYYYDHRDEIEQDLADDERFFRESDRRWDEMVARHDGRPPDNPTPEERAIPRPFPAKTDR
jgi:uncharacterized protein (DUF433 family)